MRLFLITTACIVGLTVGLVSNVIFTKPNVTQYIAKSIFKKGLFDTKKIKTQETTAYGPISLKSKILASELDEQLFTEKHNWVPFKFMWFLKSCNGSNQEIALACYQNKLYRVTLHPSDIFEYQYLPDNGYYNVDSCLIATYKNCVWVNATRLINPFYNALDE